MNNMYFLSEDKDCVEARYSFHSASGYEQHYHNTINRFRNRVKEEIIEVLIQLVLLLTVKGYVSLDVEYVDGNKI